MEPKDWLTVGLSSLALCLSIVNFVRTSRIADRQFVVQFTQDAHKWADEVLKLFIEPMGGAINNRENRIDVITLLAARTSVLWDSGRLLFPNHEAGSFGVEKGPAFEGIRPRVLDAMMALYDQFQKDKLLSRDANYQIDPILYFELKREFISCVQAEIGTRTRYRALRRNLGPNKFDHQASLAKKIQAHLR